MIIRAISVVALVLGLSFATAAPSAVARAAEGSSPPQLEIIRKLPRPSYTYGVTWSSDGSKLAAYSGNTFGDLLTIWSSDGGIYRELQREGAGYNSLSSLAFVSGNRQIVTPGPMALQKIAFSVIDIESGTVIRDVEGSHPERGWNVNSAAALAVSPDQSLLAVAFGRALPQPVVLYSAATWKEVAILPEAPANIAEVSEFLTFSRDGQLLAFDRGGGPVWIFDRRSGRITEKIEPFPEYVAAMSAFCFSPDGSMIAVATGEEWGTTYRPGGEPTLEKRAGDPVNVPILDPIRVFRTTDGSLAASLHFSDPVSPIYSMAWSPDGRLIAFGDRYNNLRLWDLSRPGEPVSIIKLQGTALSAAFSPDGSQLAVTDGPVTIFAVKP